MPSIVYATSGGVSSSRLGVAAGASHMSPRITSDGGRSHPVRLSQDLSVEIKLLPPAASAYKACLTVPER
jgi:hypothetical protein